MKQKLGLPQLTKERLKKIHTPTLYLLGGESDIAYNNGMDDYKQINHVPVFVANMNVGHGGTYNSLMEANLPELLLHGTSGN